MRYYVVYSWNCSVTLKSGDGSIFLDLENPVKYKTDINIMRKYIDDTLVRKSDLIKPKCVIMFYKEIEEEKESDRKEAMKMLEIIGEHPPCKTCEYSSYKVLITPGARYHCSKMNEYFPKDFYCKYHEVRDVQDTQ